MRNYSPVLYGALLWSVYTAWAGFPTRFSADFFFFGDKNVNVSIETPLQES